MSSTSWLEADQTEPRVARLLTRKNREFARIQRECSSPSNGTSGSNIFCVWLSRLWNHCTSFPEKTNSPTEGCELWFNSYCWIIWLCSLIMASHLPSTFLTAVFISPHLEYLHTPSAINQRGLLHPSIHPSEPAFVFLPPTDLSVGKCDRYITVTL